MSNEIMMEIFQYHGKRYVNFDDFQRYILKSNLEVNKYKELYEKTKLEKEIVEAQLYKNIRKFFE